MKRSRKGSLFAHVLVAMNMVPFTAGSPESALMSMAWLAMIASVRYRSEEQLTWLYRHASVAGNVGAPGVGSVALRTHRQYSGALAVVEVT